MGIVMDKIERNHVQGCFDREIALIETIDACETAEGVSAVVWPD